MISFDKFKEEVQKRNENYFNIHFTRPVVGISSTIIDYGSKETLILTIYYLSNKDNYRYLDKDQNKWLELNNDDLLKLYNDKQIKDYVEIQEL